MFEELDYRPTPIGVLTLRRRRSPTSDVDVYEIKLDDAFLMSSAFTVAEIALADLGLAALHGYDLDVVVGGLGLGFTAQAALRDARLRSLLVVDALPEVIEWHQTGLLPVGRELTADARCQLVHGDFFTMLMGDGFDVAAPGRCFDAILVDIDHAPDNLLHPSHAVLYDADGLTRVASLLRAHGVFALWSNDPPDAAFETLLASVFAATQARVVSFPDLRGDGHVTNTVYVALKGSG